MAETLHSFLFADICGYSRLSELRGDEVAADLAIRFACRAAEMAPDDRAEVVKCVGDAVMLHSESAADLIALGLRLNGDLDDLPRIHAGIHSGCAVERAGDWWGCTVNVAARVACAAGTGQLLITDAARRAAGDLCPASLRGLGALRLKNISAPTRVYEATPFPAPVRRPKKARATRRSIARELAPQLSLFERERLPVGALALEG